MLEIEQVVDFGNLVANSKTVSHEISLINHGSKAGEFKIKYPGEKPIAIMPSSGSVPPKSVQMIKVPVVVFSNICSFQRPRTVFKYYTYDQHYYEMISHEIQRKSVLFHYNYC